MTIFNVNKSSKRFGLSRIGETYNPNRPQIDLSETFDFSFPQQSIYNINSVWNGFPRQPIVCNPTECCSIAPAPSVTPCDPDQIGEFMSNMVSVSYTGYGPDIDGNFKDFSMGYFFYDYSEGWPPLDPRGIILSCGGEFNEIPPDSDLTVVLKIQVFLTSIPNSNSILLGYLYLEDLNNPYYNSSYSIPVQSVTGGNSGTVYMNVGPLPSPSPSVEPSPSVSIEPTPSPS